MFNRHTYRGLLVLALTLCLVCGEEAAAQTRKTVSRVQIDMEGWTLVPTLSDSRVESILTLRTGGGATGNNIAAVWFRRGTYNTWRVIAWQSQDLRNAVAYVKQTLAIPDGQDSNWPISGPFSIQNPTAPISFSNGLFTNDPIRPAVETAANPKAFLQDLVNSGYAAAVIHAELVDLIDDCPEAEVLKIMAEGVELELAQPPETAGAGEVYASDQFTLGCITFCWAWTWTISGPTLTGCALPPGGWGAPTCTWYQLQCAVGCEFCANVTCTYTRTRKRRNWDCTTCTWIETGTKTGNVCCTSTQYFLPPGCNDPGPGYVPPAGPDGCVPLPEPLGGSPGGWTGTPPC